MGQRPTRTKNTMAKPPVFTADMFSYPRQVQAALPGSSSSLRFQNQQQDGCLTDDDKRGTPHPKNLGSPSSNRCTNAEIGGFGNADWFRMLDALADEAMPSRDSSNAALDPNVRGGELSSMNDDVKMKPVTPKTNNKTDQEGLGKCQNVVVRYTKEKLSQMLQIKNPSRSGLFNKVKLEYLHQSFVPVSHPPRYSMTERAAMASLGNECLRDAVKLPDRTDRNEWIAVKVFDVFNESQLVWSLISDQCNCSKMSAGTIVYQNRELLGACAAVHIDNILKNGCLLLHDTDLFPVEPGKAFLPRFICDVKRFMRRLFRIYAHVYRHHFEYLEENDIVGHINAVFKHYLYFVKEFDLVGDDELMPLKNLIDIFMRQTVSMVEDGISDDNEKDGRKMDCRSNKKVVSNNNGRGVPQFNAMSFSPIKHARH